MRETFPRRRKWILEDAPTVAEILENFPFLEDLPICKLHVFATLSYYMELACDYSLCSQVFV